MADEGPTPNTLVEADPFDETTSSFISQFPALPPSPSPHSPSPVPSTSTPAKVPASTSSFTAQVESTTSILVWRLKRLVEDQVAVGEKQWREEKARAQHEYDQLDSQSEGQLEKIQRAEEELARVKEQLAVRLDFFHFFLLRLGRFADDSGTGGEVGGAGGKVDGSEGRHGASESSE